MTKFTIHTVTFLLAIAIACFALNSVVLANRYARVEAEWRHRERFLGSVIYDLDEKLQDSYYVIWDLNERLEQPVYNFSAKWVQRYIGVP